MCYVEREKEGEEERQGEEEEQGSRRRQRLRLMISLTLFPVCYILLRLGVFTCLVLIYSWLVNISALNSLHVGI